MRITGRHATTTVDGDGWLLGDDGSGFWIGRSAVRAALRMADGRGRPTVLAGWVGRTLGLPVDVLPKGSIPSYDHGGTALPSGTGAHPTGVPGWARARREDFRRHLLPAVMADPPIRLARFAPLVADAAAEQDAVAEAILERGGGPPAGDRTGAGTAPRRTDRRHGRPARSPKARSPPRWPNGSAPTA